MEENKYSIGKLIRGIRTELHMTQSMVCRGLCSLNAFVKIEKGKSEPNPYLISLFFQRMGVDGNKYGLAYSKREYAEFEKRNEIVYCMKEKNQKKLLSLLQEYEKLIKITNYHKQFISYVYLVGIEDMEGKSQFLLERGIETIQLTIPEFELEKAEMFRYSRIERALVAYISDKLYDIGQKEEGTEVLQKILNNMSRNIQDKEEMLHGYPEIVSILLRKQREMALCAEIDFCEMAISLLYDCQKLNGILTLLKHHLTRCRYKTERATKQKNSAWEKQIVALEKLEMDKHVIETFEQDVFYQMIEESIQGIPLEKLIKSVRYSEGMTGNQICDQICEPENYSRIERGVVKPYVATYQKLMRRVNREGYRYYPNIISDCLKDHLLYREIARDIGYFRYEEADKKLSELEKILNQKEIINQQHLQFTRTILDMRVERINVFQKREQLWKCLRLTISESVDWRNYPLNDLEITILNGIAIAEHEQGNTKEAIWILTNLKKVCEVNPLFYINDRKTYFMVLYNLVRFLGQNDEHEKAMKMADEFSRMTGNFGTSYDFISFVYLEVWNLEQLLEKQGKTLEEIKNQCFPKYQQMIMAAEATRQERLRESIQNHCKRYHGIDIL